MGDIFQIVSLSRRSGTLQLTTPTDAGEIVFRSGKVVAAFCTSARMSVGEALLGANIVAPTTYQEMLASQKNGERGPELFRTFNLPTDTVVAALESLVKKTVFQMFEWSEGTFSFVLEDAPDVWRGFSLEGSRAVFEAGLNPQYLAIEGARVRDEAGKDDPLASFLNRDQAAPPKPAPIVPAPPPVGETAPSAAAAPREVPTRLLLVDDDPLLLQMVAQQLGAHFPQLATAESVQAAWDIIAPDATGLLVAVDLIMARSDGKGILGGVELVERLRAQWPQLPIVLFTDYQNEEAEARARAMGVAEILPKPRKAQVQAASAAGKDGGATPVTEFAEKLSGVLLPLKSKTIGSSAAPQAAPVAAPVVATAPVALAPTASKPAPPPVVVPVAAPATPVAPVASVVQGAGASTASLWNPDGNPSEGISSIPAAVVAASAQAAQPKPTAPVPPPVSAPQVAPGPAPAPVAAAAPAPAIVATGTGGELRYDLAHEIAAEIADFAAPMQEELPPAVLSAGDMSTLRSMLAELIDPSNRDTIALLVLRFASHLVERAVLLLATRRVFVGLGGFSFDESSDQFVARVRQIQLGTDLDSIFSQVAKYRSAIRAPLKRSEGNTVFINGLGGTWPSDVCVAAPLVSGDRVAAILYGDNPSGKPLGPVDSLEIFLQQAGLAMDRALLERKLEDTRKKE